MDESQGNFDYLDDLSLEDLQEITGDNQNNQETDSPVVSTDSTEDESKGVKQDFYAKNNLYRINEKTGR